jgi:hypothetical protein
MTTTTAAELCGHRWRRGVGCYGTSLRHRCGRVADHQADAALIDPGTCKCRCGATTTREEAQP